MASAPRQALAAVSLLLSALLILLLVAYVDLLGGAPEGVEGLAIMKENSQLFRAHQVQDGEATSTSNGVTKFVLQEYSNSPPSAERGASSSDGLRSPASSPWRTLSFSEVADLWQNSPTFVDMFAASLAAVPYGAMFWESMPVTKNTMDNPYEYVAVDSPRLATSPANEEPFAEHISPGEGTTDVVSFRNLGRDARLVVPCRVGKGEGNSNEYAQLAAFVRGAPREQVIKFFAAVGAGLEEEVASRTDESPVWLSTSGLGVYWLHVRLDSVPKYYTYAPYAH